MKCLEVQQTLKCSNCKKSFRRLTTLQRHLKLKQCTSVASDDVTVTSHNNICGGETHQQKVKPTINQCNGAGALSTECKNKTVFVSNQALIEKCRKLGSAVKFRAACNVNRHESSRSDNSGAIPNSNISDLSVYSNQGLKRKAAFYSSDAGSDTDRSLRHADSETDSVESVYEEVVNTRAGDYDGIVITAEGSTSQHDKPLYSCTVCGKRYASEKYLSMHMCLHQSTLTNRSMYSEADELSKQSSNWVCSVCDKTFLQKSNYKNHLRTHSKLRPFICDVCSIGFKEKYHLKKHILFKHTNELNEKCRICDKRFKDATAVRAHERTHSDQRPYACNQCGKKFKTSECLWHHEKRSKSCGVKDCVTELSRIVESGSDKTENKRPVQIILIAGTDKDYWRTANLMDYQVLGKNDNNVVEFTPGEVIIDQCDSTDLKCEVVSTTENDENNADLTRAQRRMVLPEDWKSVIKQEINVESNTEEDEPQWTNDGQVAGKPISASCHISEKDKQRPFKCNTCSISFKLKAHLKKHNLYRHSNEYLCECDVCQKKFKDSSALQLHKRIHSFERPFVCECGKSFKTKENLWGHRRRKQSKNFKSCVPNKCRATKTCQILAVLQPTLKTSQHMTNRIITSSSKPQSNLNTITPVAYNLKRENDSVIRSDVSFVSGSEVKVESDELISESGDSRIAYKHPTILKHLTSQVCVDMLDDDSTMDCNSDTDNLANINVPTLSSFSGQHSSLASPMSSSLCSVFDSSSSSSIEDDKSLSSCADVDKTVESIVDSPRKHLLRSFSQSLSQEVPQLSLFTDDIQRWAEQIGANDLLFDELAMDDDDSGISNNIKDDIIGSWHSDTSWNIENNFIDVSSISYVHPQVA